MRIAHETIGGVAVLRLLDPRLDVYAADAFKAAALDALPDGAKRAVLDLSQVGFMDSKGLGVLISLLKSLGEGGAIHLAGVKPQVRKVFSLTRLDRVFPIHDDAAAAAAAAGA